ncbi:MAG: cytochrome C biogenesis protein [Desulfuromonas sp.]|nr:MAG: cytochrome C biogenesis protein [Desulfuromonas sp.]
MSQADPSFWLAFVSGLLSFVSPCVLPLIPSYMAFITGLSFAQLNEEHPGLKVRTSVLLHSGAFVLGFSLVFVALGGLAGMASETLRTFLQEGIYWFQKLGGILIFLFGLHLSGIFPLHILLGEKRLQLHNKPHGFLGTALVGVAFAAGWTPCIGPILGGILMMVAGTESDYLKGMELLAVYSLGLGIPFILAGLLFHEFLAFFNRFRRYIRLTEMFAGVLMMVVGVMLFFNLFARLTGFMYRLFPAG